MSEYLHFDRIKEHRGSYFVEYQPPVANSKFATLNLVFLQDTSWEQVAEFLDREIGYWMGRYPVPLMVWAHDDKEDMLRPNDSDSGCLVSWICPASGEIVQSRHVRDLDDFLEKSPAHQDWPTIYADVPFRTDAEVKATASEKALEQASQVRIMKLFLISWLAAIPAGYAVFEFLGPAWLGLIGLAFVLWKALKLSLKIWGRATPSPAEVAEAEKKRKMEHYFDHCERNPKGFWRLKNENFERDARKRIRKEADELAAKTSE